MSANDPKRTSRFGRLNLSQLAGTGFCIGDTDNRTWRSCNGGCDSARGSPQNDLTSHDIHRDATLVFFFFLPVTANCVGFLALLACCT